MVPLLVDLELVGVGVSFSWELVGFETNFFFSPIQLKLVPFDSSRRAEQNFLTYTWIFFRLKISNCQLKVKWDFSILRKFSLIFRFSQNRAKVVPFDASRYAEHEYVWIISETRTQPAKTRKNSEKNNLPKHVTSNFR